MSTLAIKSSSEYKEEVKVSKKSYDLPEELWLNVFSFLSEQNLITKTSMVNKAWRVSLGNHLFERCRLRLGNEIDFCSSKLNGDLFPRENLAIIRWKDRRVTALKSERFQLNFYKEWPYIQEAALNGILDILRDADSSIEKKFSWVRFENETSRYFRLIAIDINRAFELVWNPNYLIMDLNGKMHVYNSHMHQMDYQWVSEYERINILSDEEVDISPARGCKHQFQLKEILCTIDALHYIQQHTFNR